MELRALGDYTLLKVLGMGSLGTSYLAEHRYTKKLHVLKILPEELATESGFIRRFEDEVRLLANLEHPGLVKLHTVSQSQGRYFLITDAVVDQSRESTNLAQYMLARHKRLEEEPLYDLLHQIAEALDYAHSVTLQDRHAIHRGLRLNNVLVLPLEKQKLRAWVSDFGLSRIVGTGAVLTRIFKAVAEAQDIAPPLMRRYPTPPVAREQQQLLHASFLQSYSFLAPEQKRIDRPDKITRAVDVYAFGVLAYYLIIGEAPEVVLPFPSTKVEGYQFDWEALIHSCLRLDPAARPTSLVAALESVRRLTKANESHAVVSEVAKHYVTELAVAAMPVAASVGAEASGKEGVVPALRPSSIQRPQVDLDPARMFQVDTVVKPYVPQSSEQKDVQPLLTEMVIVQGGSYYRGSSTGNRDEMPRHQVSVASFAMDVHPVTNEQFVRFLEVMGGEKDSHHRDLIRLRESRIKRSGGRLSIESGYHKHPVVGVTWYGATLYAKWVGKRLPTEAEWEIAASGAGANLIHPTGDNIEKNQANFFSSDTTAVQSYPPTALGLYDLAGNVYEWCYDWYAYNYYEISVQEPENPQGPLQGVYRVLRGGCWKSLKEDLRCSRRHRNNPGTANGTYGFRCAADVVPA